MSAQALLLSLLTAALPAAAMSLVLERSVPSPTPLGTVIEWNAWVENAPSAHTIWFRFRARLVDPGAPQPYRLIRDFGPGSLLEWTATDREGTYEIEVTARDLDTGEIAQITGLAEMQPRVNSGAGPVISPTGHPLIFLYSAPPCPAGEKMRVDVYAGQDSILPAGFQPATDSAQFRTPQLTTPTAPCTNHTMNFLLAGLRPSTSYTVRHTVTGRSKPAPGPRLPFTTGAAPAGIYTQTVLLKPGHALSDPILLGAGLNGTVAAHDLEGTLLWYAHNEGYLTRVEPGATFWVVANGPMPPEEQFIRKFDLLGLTQLETNAARVNEQLKARGLRQITAFHHEVRTIGGGRVLALAGTEEIHNDVQGTGPVNIIGDMIIVFNEDLEVLWTWDTFDHLDLRRAAILGETCRAIRACPPFRLADDANDWTHGNSVQHTPDGNLLFSMRHQDWLIKIDYRNGEGDGHIIWRLGADGDFHLLSDDPSPWFSHQHDGAILPSEPDTVLVFDNGNTRVREQPCVAGAAMDLSAMVQNSHDHKSQEDGQAKQVVGNVGQDLILQGVFPWANGNSQSTTLTAQTCNSRGQLFKLDESNRTATLILNADLTVYAMAVGSAQKLPGGSYFFSAGFVPEAGGMAAYSVEVDASGKINYKARANAILYRIFRLPTLYNTGSLWGRL